jgi:DNA-binding CsgD family transcriptional regulator
MLVHMQSARVARQARNALDAFGHATMATRPDDGVLVWQTPLARKLLHQYFESREPLVPEPLLAWLQAQTAAVVQGREPATLTVVRGAYYLVLALQQQTSDEDWLIVLREGSDAAVVEAMTTTFKLTLREAECLYWVVKGKTNRDIGDILGSSPTTVKKHLEHVFAKLGVETRTAAASMAMGRIRGFGAGMGR